MQLNALMLWMELQLYSPGGVDAAVFNTCLPEGQLSEKHSAFHTPEFGYSDRTVLDEVLFQRVGKGGH